MIYKELLKAARFAKIKHTGQTRSDGSPYFIHPRRLVRRLWDIGIRDADVLQAAYLHDVMEDCNVSDVELLFLFRTEVCWAVKQLTNINASSKDFWIKHAGLLSADLGPEAKMVKLMDRLDNLVDSVIWPVWKRKRYARAALELVGHMYPWPVEMNGTVADIRQICMEIFELPNEDKND